MQSLYTLNTIKLQQIGTIRSTTECTLLIEVYYLFANIFNYMQAPHPYPIMYPSCE